MPASLVILGGGVIGIEFAFIFRALGGVEVTIIEREKNLTASFRYRISRGIDSWFVGTGNYSLYKYWDFKGWKRDLINKNKGEIKELQAEKKFW